MTTELYWLTLTALMTALFWVPYVLDRMVMSGLGRTLAGAQPRAGTRTAPLAPGNRPGRAAHPAGHEADEGLPPGPVGRQAQARAAQARAAPTRPGGLGQDGVRPVCE